MKPDIDFVKKQIEEEAKVTNKIQLGLTPEQIKKINNDCEKLKQRQKEYENIDILPKIELKDIPEVRDYSKYTRITLDNKIPVWQFNAPTNGIVHIRIKFNTSKIPNELSVYLPIFTQ
jgi:Zn-dependent M16 (insulinase) family peptidase